MWFDIARTFVAFFCGAAWALAIPIYSSPFSGCEGQGLFSVGPCGEWPEIFRGFGFVAICTLLGPPKLWPSLFSLVVVAAVAMLGGLMTIETGLAWDSHGFPNRLALAFGGLPIFLGGTTAFAIWHLVVYIRLRSIGDSHA